ncbi:hypothetical protein BOTBODRAFT_219790 [Botryobasidium botryosum FD-172 SS1]|uniref:Uncharacterized protein n=1 Tax=Botryobasidium botryosum (strain FD-172 SS1) TaxID=930990 RepID=A0A067MN10_BOTB1|nr:hypothetical protein BOTBODRAFT_219790 [Botryobasidium botryosum FD-172 SS1]
MTRTYLTITLGRRIDLVCSWTVALLMIPLHLLHVSSPLFRNLYVSPFVPRLGTHCLYAPPTIHTHIRVR